MGHNDLGTQHLAMGNLNEALKCFIRTRDYGTTDKHTVTPATPSPPSSPASARVTSCGRSGRSQGLRCRRTWV